MKDSTIKKIEKIYKETLIKLRELEALQKKILKEEIKRLEKLKIKQLQEELKK